MPRGKRPKPRCPVLDARLTLWHKTLYLAAGNIASTHARAVAGFVLAADGGNKVKAPAAPRKLRDWHRNAGVPVVRQRRRRQAVPVPRVRRSTQLLTYKHSFTKRER